jgi:hypothetical protein
MTHNEFVALCYEQCIHPDVALENDDVVKALKARDDELVQQLLTNEF